MTITLIGAFALVVVGNAGPEIIAAAGAFVATVFGLWIRFAGPIPRQQARQVAARPHNRIPRKAYIVMVQAFFGSGPFR
ncbi:hypothetical protein [Nocardia fluminea]|uniref:hypothetical protein n=1 Tax=Nocardia fluminea TaxID=134984 RepID=UPI0033FFA4EB